MPRAAVVHARAERAPPGPGTDSPPNGEETRKCGDNGSLERQTKGQASGTAIGPAAVFETAEARGITRFVAEVLPDNWEMLDVFRDGFDAHLTFHEGTDAIEFPTASWRLARERFGAGA
jgi:hypothetical protein